jgi:hypothetical protein
MDIKLEEQEKNNLGMNETFTSLQQQVDLKTKNRKRI